MIECESQKEDSIEELQADQEPHNRSIRNDNDQKFLKELYNPPDIVKICKVRKIEMGPSC